jgi:dipeptidase D
MESHTEEILKIFKEISQIPRGSGNEKQISDWVMNWAKSNLFEAEQDKYNNVLIRVPGTGQYVSDTYDNGYILQDHMDMVCQKSPESKHDFKKDPIDSVTKDGWIMTDGQTTLGADNGIGMAIALHIAYSKEVEHKPLELLFTVDEEQGLVGASNVSDSWLNAKKLVNIDSEDEGFITIGAAGSKRINFTKKYVTKKAIPSEMSTLSITITGGKGGHSGIDIHKKLANANILCARLLNILRKSYELNLVSWNGGTLMNAIPGECQCEILIDSVQKTKIKEEIEVFELIIKSEYADAEPKLHILVESRAVNTVDSYIMQKDTGEVINYILAIPHGVLGMSEEIQGMVETSNNLAVVNLNAGSFFVQTMHRSSVLSRLDEITAKLDAIAKLINAEISHGASSAPWQPDYKSDILQKVVEEYKKLKGKLPIIEVMHAGLECGVIGSKYPGMQMISIGPTIKGAHTT